MDRIYPAVSFHNFKPAKPHGFVVSLTISGAISRYHRQRVQSQDFQLQLQILTNWVCRFTVCSRSHLTVFKFMARPLFFSSLLGSSCSCLSHLNLARIFYFYNTMKYTKFRTLFYLLHTNYPSVDTDIVTHRLLEHQLISEWHRLSKVKL